MEIRDGLLVETEKSFIPQTLGKVGIINLTLMMNFIAFK